MAHHRIVVKVGTNVLTAGSDRLDLEVMASLVGQIARLHGRGLDCVVVSSAGTVSDSPRTARTCPSSRCWRLLARVD